MRFVVVITRNGTQYAYAHKHFTNIQAAQAWAEAAFPGQDWSVAQLLACP